MNTPEHLRPDAVSSPPLSGRSSCHQCATRGVCLFGGMRAEHMQRLACAIEERAFSKHEVLEIEGLAADRLSVVKVGTVMATRRGEQGHARPVALFGRGRVLGQYGFYGHAEQLGATALSPGRVCSVSTAEMYRLGVVDRDFHERLQTWIVRSYGRLADWSRVMRFKGLPHQLHASLVLFAQEQGHRTLRLPSHIALAALLSTTRESIARTLRQLEADGHLVRTDRWHCKVADTPLSAVTGD